MVVWIAALAVGCVWLLVFYSAEIINGIRSIRRRLRDDIRRRVSDKQWENMKDDFSDL